MTTDALPQLQAHYRATAVRLHRVNEALSRWEEYACAQAMPAELRPRLPRRPTLSRGALCELERALLDVLGEIEAAVAAWRTGRRN